MPPGYAIKQGTLVVPNGGTASTTGGLNNDGKMIVRLELSDADDITIMGPATLPEATNIQVSDDEAGTTWRNLINPQTGSAYVIAAGAAVPVFFPIAAMALRINCASTGGSRSFDVVKHISAR